MVDDVVMLVLCVCYVQALLLSAALLVVRVVRVAVLW